MVKKTTPITHLSEGCRKTADVEITLNAVHNLMRTKQRNYA